MSADLDYSTLLLGLVLVLSGCSTSTPIAYRAAADSDTVLVSLVMPVASFEDARAMDLSPSMKLYVADAGTDEVRLFDVSAAAAAAGPNAMPSVTPARPGLIGGTGTDQGLFLEPASVDASSALFVFVADAGNGRIQRFTSDGALVEVIPVPRGPRSGEGINPTLDDAASGARPILVESTSSNDLLVLDAVTGNLLMTDVQRRDWRSPGSADSRPVNPVDIEFFGSRIHVADAAGNRIIVYDRLGSLVGTEPVGGDQPLDALVPTEHGLATLAGSYLTWPHPSPEEQPSVVLRFDTTEHVRDVRPLGDHLLVLTNRSLFIALRPEATP